MAEKVDATEGDAVFAEAEAQRLAAEAKALAEAQALKAQALNSAKEMFDIFGPESETLNLSIGPVRVEPMKVGQVRRFLKEANKLVGPLREAMVAGELNITALKDIDQNALMDGLAIATLQPVAKLDQLEMAEFIKLVTKVLLVNFDFFIQTLPNLLGGVTASVLNSLIARGAGPILSNSLSATVTPSAESSPTP